MVFNLPLKYNFHKIFKSAHPVWCSFIFVQIICEFNFIQCLYYPISMPIHWSKKENIVYMTDNASVTKHSLILIPAFKCLFDLVIGYIPRWILDNLIAYICIIVLMPQMPMLLHSRRYIHMMQLVFLSVACVVSNDPPNFLAKSKINWWVSQFLLLFYSLFINVHKCHENRCHLSVFLQLYFLYRTWLTVGLAACRLLFGKQNKNP